MIPTISTKHRGRNHWIFWFHISTNAICIINGEWVCENSSVEQPLNSLWINKVWNYYFPNCKFYSCCSIFGIDEIQKYSSNTSSLCIMEHLQRYTGGWLWIMQEWSEYIIKMHPRTWLLNSLITHLDSYSPVMGLHSIVRYDKKIIINNRPIRSDYGVSIISKWALNNGPVLELCWWVEPRQFRVNIPIKHLLMGADVFYSEVWRLGGCHIQIW